MSLLGLALLALLTILVLRAAMLPSRQRPAEPPPPPREDYSRFHGTNERVAVADLELSVRFFARLIELTDGE